jgi:integrase
VPKTKKKRRSPKTVLRIPDLAHSKSAVLNSLGSESSHRTYDYAIDKFIDWYCSEPRLAFNRMVVLRYRIHFEQLRYAPSTINLHLAAVRRLAFEAADTGLLSPELAAGIARVKGIKRLGVRMGTWLSAQQGKNLVDCYPTDSPRGLRNRAMVSVLIGCGLRRAELLNLRFEDLQIREEHWVIADLSGKGGHIRTVPVPSWVKCSVDRWAAAGGVTTGRIFRAIDRFGRVWGGDGLTDKVYMAGGQAGCLENQRNADFASK